MVDATSFTMPDFTNPASWAAGFQLPGSAAPATVPPASSVGGLVAPPTSLTTPAVAAANPAGAGIGGAATGVGGGVGLGANIGTGQLAIGGLSALGNLWTAWNATNLAKQQFSFQKNLASDNYTNQAKGYNTELADKANTRAAMENQTPGQAQQYIAANSLKTVI